MQLTDDAPDHAIAASDIQKKAIKEIGRNYLSQLVHAKGDKDKIAAWRLELNRILQIFNVRSVVLTSSLLTTLFSDQVVLEHPRNSSDTNATASDTHAAVSYTRDDVSKVREEISGQVSLVSDRFLALSRGECLSLPRSQPGQPHQFPKNPKRTGDSSVRPVNHLGDR